MLEIDINARIDAFTLHIKTSIETQGITAIFGPSGSGKSSLLNIIAGFQTPKELNTVVFNGQTWLSKTTGKTSANTPIHKRRIAYVTQTPSLFEHLTVDQNLDYALKRRAAADTDQTKPSANINRDDLSERLKLQPLLKKLPSQISGGEQQRVAIARALLSSPQLVLFDEPLSALDEANREDVLVHLENLHQDFKLPFLYVTHNFDELMRLADRVILLEQGSLIAHDRIDKILPNLHLPLSGHRNAGVVINGIATEFDNQYQLIKLALGSQQHLWVNGSQSRARAGNPIRIRVYAKDVSITLSPASDSSILNIIPAVIEEISAIQNGQAVVKLRCDTQTLLSRVTVKSLQQLQLDIGKAVYAQIKGIALLGAG